MATPRKYKVCLESTTHYHLTSRCVRQAYLLGENSGRGNISRRELMRQRIYTLINAYSINLLSYALMGNHYHLVVNIDLPAAEGLSDHEVLSRWYSIHKPPRLVKTYLKGYVLNDSEKLQLSKLVKTLRERLTSLSWFMKDLNEYIARIANQQDGAKGKFWEERFGSQALLDVAAIVAAMVYVDLNPIRASVAKTPEDSDFTSICYRMAYYRKQRYHGDRLIQADVIQPLPVSIQDDPEPIPFTLEDYIELVDQSGRIAKLDKRGAIATHLPPALERLQCSRAQWLVLCLSIDSNASHAVGHLDSIKGFFKRASQRTQQYAERQYMNLLEAA